MKKIYLLSLAITLFAFACTSSETAEDTSKQATQQSTEQTTQSETEQVIVSEDGTYETVIIKGDIPSPMKEMRTTIGEAAVIVNYGSPAVKDRKVWGDLVPFDAVWRTGANEATTFETSTDLKIQGQDLPAGKYGLFTIPTQSGEWTVIFNSIWEQWGAYKYEASKDVLRVTATATETDESSETMEFVMDGENLVFKWENLALPITITK